MRRMLVGAAAAAALVITAGCGTATNLSAGSSSAALTQSGFAAAMQQATASARSVHVDGTFAGDGKTLRLAVDEQMKGTASIEDLTATITARMSGLGSFQMRLVDGSAYIQIAHLSGIPQLGGLASKPWLKVDLTDPSGQFAKMFGKLGRSLDAGSIAKTFASATKLEDLGPANIDGVQTRHYRVTVDTSKAADLLGLPMSELGTKLPRTIAYDAWLDADNRPFQLSGTAAGLTMTLSFSHWGESIHVVAPPASQVQPFSL